MRDLIFLFVHVVTVLIRLVRPGGMRAILAESVLLRHQLLVLNRSRHRGPNLRTSDRLINGLCVILVLPATIGTICNRGEAIAASQLSSRSGSSKIPAFAFRKTQNEAGTERPKRGSDSCRC